MEEFKASTKILSEMYPTLSSFETMMLDVWGSFMSLHTITITTAEKKALNNAIYEWYRDSNVFDDDEDVFVNEMKTHINKGALSVLAKLRKYGEVLKDAEKLLVKGGLESHRTSTIDRTDTDTRTSTRTGSMESQNEGGNESFTKQADTPTIQASTTEFVDTYTDYQSKTKNESDLKTTTTYNSVKDQRGGAITMDDDEKHDTIIARTGSTMDALDVLRSIPTNIYEPIYECISPLFVSIYYL